jgi:hypothetical protein
MFECFRCLSSSYHPFYDRVGKLMTYEDVALCVAQANFPKYRLVGIPT